MAERTTINPHQPIRPPRPGHIGEQVYAELWERTICRVAHDPDADDDSRPLAEVFGDWRATIRRCRIAASFICWLGTNCGQGFIFKARKYVEKKIDCAWRVAWWSENCRIRGVNSGRRTLEHLIATPEREWPDLSADDFETLECVASWLGSTRGQEFIAAAEYEIMLRQSERARGARKLEMANG